MSLAPKGTAPSSNHLNALCQSRNFAQAAAQQDDNNNETMTSLIEWVPDNGENN